MSVVGERRWKDDKYVIAKANGEDWVHYASEDDEPLGTVTMYQWNKLLSEPENETNDEEWPYSQE